MPIRPTQTPSKLIIAALALLAVLTSCGGRDTDPGTGSATSLLLPTTTAGGDTASSGSQGAEDDKGDDSDDTENGPAVTGEVATTASPPDPSWRDVTYPLVEVAQVDEPTALTTRPDSDDLYLAERSGQVRHVDRRPGTGNQRASYELLEEPTLDITDLVGTGGEGGLLGLAFSSDGEVLYVSYTNRDGVSIIAEYEMAGAEADPSSGQVLLRVDQPFANHNGGQITRGPDDLLYIGFGDGGSGGDPHGNGQDTSTLLGSILRVDPERTAGEVPYGLPPDNPFADDQNGRPEIWLWGVRNPWRFSFDRSTGDLWIADVGQNRIEEITLLPLDDEPAGRGANLGWRVYEGNEVFDEAADPPADHTGPIYTYAHDDGRCSITGGYVYRGERIPGLTGVYLFADYCTGEIFGLQPTGGGVLVADLVTDSDVGNIVSFGEDPAGELYVLASGGSVYLIDRP